MLRQRRWECRLSAASANLYLAVRRSQSLPDERLQLASFIINHSFSHYIRKSPRCSGQSLLCCYIPTMPIFGPDGLRHNGSGHHRPQHRPSTIKQSLAAPNNRRTHITISQRLEHPLSRSGQFLLTTKKPCDEPATLSRREVYAAVPYPLSTM